MSKYITAKSTLLIKVTVAWCVYVLIHNVETMAYLDFYEYIQVAKKRLRKRLRRQKFLGSIPGFCKDFAFLS